MSEAEKTPGVPRREGRGYVNSFGEGRPCAFKGCETVLSRYNDRDVCWAHERDRGHA